MQDNKYSIMYRVLLSQVYHIIDNLSIDFPKLSTINTDYWSFSSVDSLTLSSIIIFTIILRIDLPSLISLSTGYETFYSVYNVILESIFLLIII